MKSAVFKGQVRHRRFRPVEHAFSYRMFMLYLDLEELDTLFRPYRLWSTTGPAVARFRRQDHLGDPTQPLQQCVRELVEAETGRAPTGPIRLLTHLRYFGYGFNPVSFYYCFDAADQRVEVIVAEVNNTPWGEQHCYVMPADQDRPLSLQQRFSPDKAMHVSPFMPMDVDYDWRFSEPGQRLAVHMRLGREGEHVFDASLDLRRHEVSAWTLMSCLLRYPFMTAQIIFAIHWQALRLWIKGCPVHDHPDRAAALMEKAE